MRVLVDVISPYFISLPHSCLVIFHRLNGFKMFTFQMCLTLMTEQIRRQVGEPTSWTTQPHTRETAQNCRKVGKTAGCCGNQVNCKVSNGTHLREALKSGLFLHISIKHRNKHVMYAAFLCRSALFCTYIIDNMEVLTHFTDHQPQQGLNLDFHYYFPPFFQLEPNEQPLNLHIN